MSRKQTNYEKHLTKKLRSKAFRGQFEQAYLQIETAHQIAALRRRRKMTQAELAKRLGTSRTAVARMEAGEQNLTLDMLGRVSTAFGRRTEVKL